MADKKKKKPPKPKRKTGRPSLLTPEIAEKCEILYGLQITDAGIAKIIGIPYEVMDHWKVRNTTVELRGQTIGFGSIREHARETLESTYIGKLLAIIKAAQAKEDYGTAGKYLTWLLEKQFPKKYGALLKLEGDISTRTALTEKLAEITDDQLQSIIDSNSGNGNGNGNGNRLKKASEN